MPVLVTADDTDTLGEPDELPVEETEPESLTDTENDDAPLSVCVPVTVRVTPVGKVVMLGVHVLRADPVTVAVTDTDGARDRVTVGLAD